MKSSDISGDYAPCDGAESLRHRRFALHTGRTVRPTMTRRLCFLIAVAAAAGCASAAAAATPVVPIFTQHQIATTAPSARLRAGAARDRLALRALDARRGRLRIFFRTRPASEIDVPRAPFNGDCAAAGMEKSFQLAGVKVWWGQTLERAVGVALRQRREARRGDVASAQPLRGRRPRAHRRVRPPHPLAAGARTARARSRRR